MSKFTEMMLHAEEEQALIAEWLPDRKQAVADWRAMREAWEAMVEAITQLCDDADEYDLLRDYVTVDRVLYENLTAALAKARAK